MLQKMINVFLYNGVDKDVYKRVLPKINKANQIMVSVFSGMGVILTATMLILSFFISGISGNRMVYIIGFIGILALFLGSFFFANKNSWFVITSVYIAFSIFFLYGILIGTVTNPGQLTVTFMVMLVFLPVLFNDRPLRMILIIAAYVILFICLCYKNKTGDVLSTDVLDACIFSSLGAASGSIINSIKVRSYVLEAKLHDASRFDQLTEVCNRNSFEADLSKYPAKCQWALACIYVDVNGLHELNNNEGHEVGDRMLQFIAKQMRDMFGSDTTYRIGGDEFVAFVIDNDEEHIKYLLGQMNEIIEREGYHTAVGLHLMEKPELDMDVLIKTAESEMYKSKSQFYKDKERDRRKR